MPFLFQMSRKYAAKIILAFLGLTVMMGCSKGPMDPVRLEQIHNRDDYIRLAKFFLAHDEIFYLNEAGESLFIDALNLSPQLLAAGRTRWTEDKRYTGLLEKWLPVGPPARVVLVGLYTRGIVKEDVLTNGRFRFQLKTGGRLLEPLAVEEVKPEILEDYFPVFNRWEKVVAVRFPVELAPSGSSLLVHWPSGDLEVPLVEFRSVPASPAG
ncbi:MAG: hypothetical protein LBP22_07515 [Deltaproteobacteria bacterium]|nr:hypothetical protein [Deltaproteobacteria bacterium]